MNNKASDILTFIIKRHGRKVIRDVTLCRAFLSDLLVDYPDEKQQLIALCQHEIPQQLVAYQEKKVTQEVLNSFIKNKIQNAQQQGEDITWGVDAWFKALELSHEEIHLDIVPPHRNDTNLSKHKNKKRLLAPALALSGLVLASGYVVMQHINPTPTETKKQNTLVPHPVENTQASAKPIKSKKSHALIVLEQDSLIDEAALDESISKTTSTEEAVIAVTPQQESTVLARSKKATKLTMLVDEDELNEAVKDIKADKSQVDTATKPTIKLAKNETKSNNNVTTYKDEPAKTLKKKNQQKTEKKPNQKEKEKQNTNHKAKTVIARHSTNPTEKNKPNVIPQRVVEHILQTAKPDNTEPEEKQAALQAKRLKQQKLIDQQKKQAALEAKRLKQQHAIEQQKKQVALEAERLKQQRIAEYQKKQAELEAAKKREAYVLAFEEKQRQAALQAEKLKQQRTIEQQKKQAELEAAKKREAYVRAFEEKQKQKRAALEAERLKQQRAAEYQKKQAALEAAKKREAYARAFEEKQRQAALQAEKLKQQRAAEQRKKQAALEAAKKREVYVRAFEEKQRQAALQAEKLKQQRAAEQQRKRAALAAERLKQQRAAEYQQKKAALEAAKKREAYARAFEEKQKQAALQAERLKQQRMAEQRKKQAALESAKKRQAYVRAFEEKQRQAAKHKQPVVIAHNNQARQPPSRQVIQQHRAAPPVAQANPQVEKTIRHLASAALNDTQVFFVSHIQLRKKHADLDSINELISLNNSPTYRRQSDKINQKISAIQKKLDALSASYSHKLNQLCNLSPSIAKQVVNGLQASAPIKTSLTRHVSQCHTTKNKSAQQLKAELSRSLNN